jgi:hypothetical protein
MGNVISNLKVRFGIDTGDFKKGLKDGEKAVESFKDSGKESIDKFADIFGVNMESVRSSMNMAGKSFNFLAQSFKGAAAGGDFLSISMKVLKNTMLATGIGALIVLLGSLTAYFTETERGALKASQAISQIKAVGTVLLDHLASLGEGLWDFFTGKGQAGAEAMSKAFKGIIGDISNASAIANEYSQAVHDLTYEEMNFNLYKSEQIVVLDDYRLKARDLDLSAQERLANLKKAGEIEKAINEKEKVLALDKIQVARLDLNMFPEKMEKKKALNDAYVEYNNIVANSIEFERTLTKETNKLTKEIINQLEAQKKLNMEGLHVLSDSGVPDVSKPGNTKGKNYDPTKLAYMNTQPLVQYGKVATEMGNTVNDAFQNMSAGFGEWVGNFAAGSASLKDAGKMVGNAFGDMLINLGKVAISTGIGIEAIKKAFASMNGIAAIGIGVTLIAFGTAIKGSIAAAGSTSGSSSSSGNSGSSGGGLVLDSRGTNAQPIPINISGELVAKGKDLVYVFNQENLRKKIST